MEISVENAHLSSGYGDDFMSLIADDLLCLICQPPRASSDEKRP